MRWLVHGDGIFDWVASGSTGIGFWLGARRHATPVARAVSTLRTQRQFHFCNWDGWDSRMIGSERLCRQCEHPSPTDGHGSFLEISVCGREKDLEQFQVNLFSLSAAGAWWVLCYVSCFGRWARDFDLWNEQGSDSTRIQPVSNPSLNYRYY